MYNVLEKIRGSITLDANDKRIYENGLVSTLLELHTRLDHAVLDAYGWPHDITESDILVRLVALNAVRAEEERSGTIRYLRPEYQNPTKVNQDTMLEVPDEPMLAPAKIEKIAFPKTLGEQSQAIRNVLKTVGKPLSNTEIIACFKGAKKDRVSELLEMLGDLGQVRTLEGDRYSI
jgi:hypothetical protein